MVLGDPCGRLVLLQHRTSEATDTVAARVLADALAAAAGLGVRYSLFNATHTPPTRMCSTISALASALDRVTLTETRPFNMFQELLAVADVAIDPYPFGEWGAQVLCGSHGRAAREREAGAGCPYVALECVPVGSGLPCWRSASVGLTTRGPWLVGVIVCVTSGS